MRENHLSFNFNALSTHQLFILLLMSKRYNVKVKCKEMLKDINVNPKNKMILQFFFELTLISSTNIHMQPKQLLPIFTYAINIFFSFLSYTFGSKSNIQQSTKWWS
jgi:hypothetical protein